MTEPLGFVVLARRPNPWAQDPWDYWAVGKLYRDEAQAITARPRRTSGSAIDSHR